MKRGRKPDEGVYALYKGDEFLDLGTLEELAIRFNMKRKSMQWLKTPSAQNRVSSYDERHILIKVDDDEELEYIRT